MNSYIIRNDESIYAIYCENNCIRQRKRIDSKWSKAETIATNVGGSFSLMHSNSKEPIILYQDNKGNLMLTNNDNPHKMVLRNTSEIKTLLHINGIVSDNTIRIFYNKDYINESYLTEQHRRDDGSWSKPFALDNYVSDENMTKLIRLENNYILFYSKKVPEQQIGYREISPYSIGDFKMLYATGYKILDYSLAVTSEEIHIAIVTGTNRNNKLLYIKKDKNGISKAKTIYDGFVKNCHISILNSKIIIIFNTITGNSRITSYDMGNSFRRIEGIEHFTFNKTIFADYTRQIADNFVATELLSDINFPYDAKYCPFINNSDNEVEKLKKEIERLKNIAKM